MKEERPITHSELVAVAIKYAQRRCPIVISEVATTGEEPDVLGWTGSGSSVLFECKATRSDFLADRRKPYRANPEAGVGDFRYFFTPRGLVTRQELPAGWGLIEYDGKRFFTVANSEAHRGCAKHELRILISVLRRIGRMKPKGVSIKAYYYETQNRAQAHIEVEEVAA